MEIRKSAKPLPQIDESDLSLEVNSRFAYSSMQILEKFEKESSSRYSQIQLLD